MLERTSAKLPLGLLNLAAYVTIAAIGFVGIATIYSIETRWLALGLLALFAFLFHTTVQSALADRPRVTLVALSFQTAAAILLSFLSLPSSSASDYLSLFFFLLSAEVMLTLTQRWALAWIILFWIATTSIFVYANGIESGLRSALLTGPGFLFFGAFAAALRQVQSARVTGDTLLEELRVAHEQLKSYASQVEKMAAVEERNRLAREMHDSLGHRLTVAAVQLEGAQRLIDKDPARAASMVETVRALVRDALGELRQTVAALRQSEPLNIVLPQSLQELCSSFEQGTGLAVRTVLPDELPELPPAYRLSLYRAAQEGLTNVQRHARAQNVVLALSCQDNKVAITVRDDGVGYPESRTPGFGLLGLEERAALLGGELRLKNRPEGGAELTFTLPWPRPVEDERA